MNIGTLDMKDCKVGWYQVEKIMAGDREVWTNEYAPLPITDFSASKLQIDKITINFSTVDGKPTPSYRLVNDDTEEVLVANIWDNYDYPTTEASINLRIDAFNNAGVTPSNVDTGTTKEPAGEIESNTAGSHTFIAPRGYTEVDLCMIGGGGSGRGSGWGVQNANLGGGYAGAVVTQAVTVVSQEEIAVVVGAGGQRTSGAVGSRAGSASSFKGISANGGAGGTNGTAYAGNNGSRTTCGGTFNDGVLEYYSPHNARAYGGQAGFGNGGRSSQTISVASGTRGAGGGGGWILPDRAGHGGSGVVRISWGD